MEQVIIKDTEYGDELTLRELQAEYEALKKAGETEAESFEDYLENITGQNGTCEWCGERFDKSELQEEVDLGQLCRQCVLGISSRGEELFLKH